MKKIFRYLLWLFAALMVLALLFLEIMTLLDYKPAPQTMLYKSAAQSLPSDTITILSWNIGYAGLNADMDFFYDGGHMTRASKAQTQINLAAIAHLLKANDSADIILLQEIDKKAHRSYGMNEVDSVAKILPQHTLFFAKDYDVAFVPMPISNPMGSVQSGIATLSRHLPKESVQYAYPSQNKWPVRLFLLDNCFLLTRYPLANNKELVVINTHNSAYNDSNGEKRKIEMNYLRTLLIDEYKKGNYVIAGGDWNQTPPPQPNSYLLNNMGYEAYISYNKGDKEKYKDYFVPMPIPTDFMPEDWLWATSGRATNRFLYEPYTKGQTAETAIDFFLISPNVECDKFITLNLGFAHSDHNPIIARFIVHTTPQPLKFCK